MYEFHLLLRHVSLYFPFCIFTIFYLRNYANGQNLGGAEPGYSEDSIHYDYVVEESVLEVKPIIPTITFLDGGFPIRDASAMGTNRYGHNLTPEDKFLRVATIVDPPFVAYFNLTDEQRRIQKTGPGVVIEILNAMKHLHGFEYAFFTPSDGLWGDQIDDGRNWNGMFGMLQRDEVDMVAAASIARDDRQQVADYTYPCYSSEMGMLIRSPERYIDNRFLIVTAPFHKYVWALAALAIIVSGGIMKAVSTALRSVSEVQYNLLQSTWIFFSVFVQQGLPVQPKSWSCRTLLAFWWLAALTLVATFTGNMVALFSVNRLYLPFNTRDEMIAKVVRSGYSVITTNTSVTRLRFMQVFQDSKQEVIRTLWYEMSVKGKWVNVSTYEEGVELVKRKPNYVFIGPKETLAVFAARDCSVTTTNGGLVPVMYTLAFKRNYRFIHLWSKEIRELVELGFLTKWLSDFMHAVSSERGTRCGVHDGVTNAGDAIDIVRAQGAFWILIGGATFASFGLITEYIIRLSTKLINFLRNKKGKKLSSSDRRDEPASSRNHRSVQARYGKTSSVASGAADQESARSYRPTRVVSQNYLPNSSTNGGATELKLRRNRETREEKF